MKAQRAGTISFLALRHVPVVLLSALYLYGAGWPAALRPLWYDEIFTRTVASLESPAAIVLALLDKADNHPPLDYLVRHLSMTMFGESALAFRLPSVLAVLAASLCLYAFVLRRCSLLPALVAFSFLLSTRAQTYATEGRGYAFLLASMCLALLAWQMAAEKPSVFRLGFLILSLSAGPFSHYYGVLNYAPIVAGEAWRSWERRKICWPIVFAVVLSLASLLLLVPFAMNASEYTTAFWTRFGPVTPFHFYANLLARSFPPLIASLVVCWGIVVLWPEHDSPRPVRGGFRRHEIVAALVLCIVPFLTYVLAELVTGALQAKYALITVVGVTLLFANLMYCVESWRRAGAVAVALCFCIWTAAFLVNHATKPSHRLPPVPEDVIALIDTAGMPIVMADVKEFLLAQTYLAESRRRKIYYLSDRKSALKYKGFDTNERALMNLSRFAQINIVNFCEFTKEHREFLLIGDTEDWQIRKLGDGKASLTLQSSKRYLGSIYKVDLGEWNDCA